ncbi:hypothetical protein [Deinococcus sp. RIT780]|uniref:hypothetical protein n=1 Tax=Deinococcus sp. RIT780 TaxID=2870472 RepID=UPI001C8969A2|nr:hypothetical protein [Deinococcus sp. RIT780]MBX8464319.1 hypothetical protein [Deinococcus sp. RIT780]
MKAIWGALGFISIVGIGFSLFWGHFSGQKLTSVNAASLSSGSTTNMTVHLTPAMSPVRVFFSGSAARHRRMRSSGDYVVTVSTHGKNIFRGSTRMSFKGSGSNTLKSSANITSNLGSLDVVSEGDYEISLRLPVDSDVSTKSAAVVLRGNSSDAPSWLVISSLTLGLAAVLGFFLHTAYNERMRRRIRW